MGLLGRSWGGLEAILGPPGPLLAPLGAALGPSWAALGASWELLGRSWAVLGCPRRLLGGSWGTLGRSKNDQKIDPKIDPKSSRIATEKKRSGATPVDVSELDRTQTLLDEATRKSYQNRYRYD